MLLLRYLLIVSVLLGGLDGAAQHLPRMLGKPTARPMEATQRLGQTATTRPGKAVYYSWNAAQAAWTQPLLDRLTYTPQGQLAERITSDSASATAFQRVSFTYDSQGNLLEQLIQTGNGLPWINQFRYLSSYDTQNQLIEELSQTWTNNAWQTTDGYRYQNTYAGSVLTQQIVQLFDAGAFVNDTRFEYLLTNGQWAEATAQRWTGTAWANEERILDLTWYNWANRQPAGFRVQAWQNAGQWTDFQRHTISYGHTGTTVQLLEEALPTGSWQNFARYTEPKDTWGNDLGYRQEDWLNGGWVLTNELRAQLFYNAQNQLIRRIEQLYSPITAQFANRLLVTYGNFQTITAVAASKSTVQLRLYPVPVTNALHVEISRLPTQQVVPLEIRTATGQVVQRLTGQPQQGVLRLTLPVQRLAPGLYSLHVLTRQGAVIQRFVRE
ncbi:T9SS type A sorting domain-containing protein [Hymenobacter metallilatus]|uniref:T9SS C-terminal target domain-containing protein n=1 Tax=Hymenobacter metallilatus TaxID=2493666 RepID=A0A428JIP8_9BACT|nr:T9SS type A sorting domain-containing protein [Hymenobacter metallilatus]RSK32522.1 T9SS C-terminal target domain-containing protein [Hymenobacter metallilatus]